MRTDQRLNLLAGLMGLFVTTPIWFYLFFEILKSVNASPLMWFLYWVYLPVTLFVAILVEIARATKL